VIKVSHSESEPADESRMFDESEVTKVTRTQRLREMVNEGVVVPFKIAWSDWRTKIGLIIIGMFVLTAVLTALHKGGTYILNDFLGLTGVEWRLHRPSSILSVDEAWRRELKPFENMEYPLGTDRSGRGLLSAITWSTPAMLKMIIAGGVFSSVMATVVGTVAGYKRGRAETFLMTVSDIAMSIPGIPLVIVMIVIIQPDSPYVLGALITINVWAGLARTVHSQVLSIREESYVEASRAMGIRTPRIIQKDILPRLMPYVMVNFVYASRRVIYDSVALYFLGFLPIKTPNNWGVMMNWAYEQNGALTPDGPQYMIIVPMLPIIFLSLGFILISQGTDRLFNPRVRTRHEGETRAEEGPTEEDTTQTGIQ